MVSIFFADGCSGPVSTTVPGGPVTSDVAAPDTVVGATGPFEANVVEGATGPFEANVVEGADVASES